MKFKFGCFLIVYLCLVTGLQAQFDTLEVLRLDSLSELKLNKIRPPQTQDALKLAQKALQIAEKLQYTRGIALSYSRMGNVYHYENQPKQAIEHYQRAFDEYQKLPDSAARISQITCLMDLGYTSRLHGKIVQAHRYYQEALVLSQKYNQWLWIAHAQAHLGLLNYMQANYSEAMRYYTETLATREKIQDKKGIAESLVLIGDLYVVQERYEQAREHYKKARPIFQSINNNTGRFATLLNTGKSYLAQKQYDKALDYYEQALKIAQDHEIFPPQVKALNAIANWYEIQQKPTLSLRYYQQALALQRSKVANKALAAEILGNIGTAYAQTGQHAEALQYFQMAMDTAVSLDMKNEIQKNYKRFADLYEKLGQYQKANQYLQQYMSLTEVLTKQANSDRIKQIMAQYEIEDREKQIQALEEKQATQRTELHRNLYALIVLLLMAGLFVIYLIRSNIKRKKLHKILLTQKNAINRQYDQFAALDKLRNRFFSVISHDLRNALLGLRNYVFLMTEKAVPTEQGLHQLDEAIKETDHLLENLLQWSFLQMRTSHDEMRVINLKQMIDDNIKLLSIVAVAKNIRIDNLAPKHTYVEANIDKLQLIIRNLLSNALKYTEPDGIINLNVYEHAKNWEVVISDTGIGISPEQLKDLFDPNISKERTKRERVGLGLWLCQDYIRQLNGEIWATSEIGRGSSFHFTLPKDFLHQQDEGEKNKNEAQSF